MNILFVCLGNICRSPTAHGVMLKKLIEHNLEWINIDSAGTASYNIGRPPDERSQAAARNAGYDLSSLRARQVEEEDFFNFDIIYAMDKSNLSNLRNMQPSASTAKVSLFLEQGTSGLDEVPDPYYGSADGFKSVVKLCEDACDGIISTLTSAKN